MLTSLRKGAQTWIAAVFIFLLAGSFAVWGVGDWIGGALVADVATIGDRKITQVDYRRAYDAELQRTSQRYGRALQREQARLVGVDQRTLGGLLGTLALDMHAEELNLGISDDAVAARIKRDPAFASVAGGFSADRFRQTLTAQGLTEAGFLARQREGLLRQQLTATVTDEVAVPNVMMDALNTFQNETRMVNYFLVSPELTKAIPEPDETALKTFYDNNKREFTAPEFRKVDMIVLQPQMFMDKIELTDADLKENFEARSNEFNTPEKRLVEQITFTDEAAAQKAYEELKGGKDFDKLADEQGREDRFISYGAVTPDGIIDAAISKAAFSMEKPAFSEPIKGSLSTAIVRVREITPAANRTFDEVKEQIRRELLDEKAAERVADLYDDIEDDRAKGLTILDITAKRDLPALEVAAIDAQGNGPDGKPVNDVPGNEKLHRGIVAADVDLQNDPVELTQDSFVWYEVRAVIDEQLKPFDTVKADVKASWTQAEVRRAVGKLATELVGKINGGETIEAVAKDQGRTVSTVDAIKRTARLDDLPSGAVGQIFTLAKGAAASAAIPGGNRRVVFQLQDIKAPPPASETEKTAIQNAVMAQLNEELVAQYLADLQSRYEVKVNQTAIEQATSPSGPAGGGYGRGTGAF